MSLYQKDVRDQKGLRASSGGGGAQKYEQTGMGENLTIGFHVMKVLS